MTLQLLIPQYNEDEQIIKSLLDSIAIQQSINFTDISVLIGNDGSETRLPQSFLNSYPFSISYFFFQHSGLAGCRQHLFDLATADYIMYCDADDMFNANTALWCILKEIGNKHPNALVCDFWEEQPSMYAIHNDDCIFVHGKVYNRTFLLANEIKWHTDIGTHQDSCYNLLALTCAGKETTVYIHFPLYLWKWRSDSICRGDALHSVHTWCSMLTSYDHLIEDLMTRGFGGEARYYAQYMLYATYYEQCHAEWQQSEAESYIFSTAEKLRELFCKYHLLLKYLTEKDINIIKEAAYKTALTHGNVLENKLPFEEWLNNILTSPTD